MSGSGSIYCSFVDFLSLNLSFDLAIDLYLPGSPPPLTHVDKTRSPCYSNRETPSGEKYFSLSSTASFLSPYSSLDLPAAAAMTGVPYNYVAVGEDD